MAEEMGSAAGKAVRTVALKSFMNPSIDIIKTIPQGFTCIIYRIAREFGRELQYLADLRSSFSAVYAKLESAKLSSLHV